MSSKIIGIQWEFRNSHRLAPSSTAAVVVANHQSFFDVLGMFEIWHVMVKCTAIARKKIFYIWPFGLVAWMAGVVFIDRVPGYEKSREKINEAASFACKEKAKLWMFPEGTRNKNPSELLPFKKGAFRVAVCCQIPIIPVVFSPYYFIDEKKMYFGRGKVMVEILEPISTKGLQLEDVDDLMQKVRDAMSKKNEELRKEILKKE